MDSLPVKIGIAGGILMLVLSSMLIPQFQTATPQSGDVLAQVMGGTADFAAQQAYQEADIYFHAGVRLKCNHEGPREDHCDGRDDEPVAQPQQDLPLIGWVQTMQNATTPKGHRHLSNADSKEMLPWFVLATRLNPRNVEAWSTGTYWFYRSGQTAQAEDFINAGVRNNPTAYRLYLDRGVLYYHERRWDKATSDLNAARKYWKNLDEDSPYDLKAIGRYSGYARAHKTVGA